MTIFRYRRVSQAGKIAYKHHVSGATVGTVGPVRARMFCGRVITANPTDLKELPKLEEAVCRPCAHAFYRRLRAA